MKYNNFLIALVFCVALQPVMSFASQEPIETEGVLSIQQSEGGQQAEKPQIETTPQSPTYWQQYAPQFMQDISNSVYKKYKDTIGKWSTRKKMLVVSAVLASLVGAYYRNEIMQMITGIRTEQEAPIIAHYDPNTGRFVPPLGEVKSKYEETVEQYWYQRIVLNRGSNWRTEEKIGNLRHEMLEQGMSHNEINKLNDLAKEKVYRR